MSINANATVDYTSWDEKNYDEGEGLPTLARTEVANGYRGDLEASGAARGLMIYLSADSAEFTGLERITGRLGGRTGSFVVRTGGAYASGTVSYEWSIVPGSGTGELQGLRGTGKIVWNHGESGALTVEYDLP